MNKTFSFFKWTGKKAVLLFVLSVALVVTSVNVTVAVLLTKTEPIENTFTPPVLHVSLEGIDDIKNTGDVPVYVRAFSVVNWVSTDNEHTILSTKPKENVDFKVEFHTDGWFLASDGFYYFENALAPGEELHLFDMVTQLVEKPGYELRFEILSSAIQATPTEAVEEAWRAVKVADDGTLVSADAR